MQSRFILKILHSTNKFLFQTIKVNVCISFQFREKFHVTPENSYSLALVCQMIAFERCFFAFGFSNWIYSMVSWVFKRAVLYSNIDWFMLCVVKCSEKKPNLFPNIKWLQQGGVVCKTFCFIFDFHFLPRRHKTVRSFIPSYHFE